jgi:4-hydroxybenzoyl-CoA thioesterase
MLESRVMFETRFQTYWSDVDAAGIVYFPHFFRFVEQAEEELFRASGNPRRPLIDQLGIWMPRVEAFSKFSKPIRLGAAIRVRLSPQIEGEKTIRYEFEIVDDESGESLAAGYVTVVCVDAARFKATPMPDVIRNIIRNAQSE